MQPNEITDILNKPLGQEMLARDFTGLTEIRPGNAVFMDMTQVALGVATRAEIEQLRIDCGA